MNIELILKYVVLFFPVSEIALMVFKRSKEKSSEKGDRGSLQILWITIVVSISLAITLQWYPMATIQLPKSVLNVIALCILITGLNIRWFAIISLGKYFTVDVAIQETHTLVIHGMYKYVRHPSYLGLLIEFIGLAVYFGKWSSIAIIVIPISVAILYRIRIEEQLLCKKFGKQYEEYMSNTKSLIPGVV